MKIFITLDYELFLGSKTGTPENCLIRPMDDLCACADKYGVKYIVFVDAAYLLRLYQLKNKFYQIGMDYELVSSHILSLHNAGHDIQLHFHPQWIYSEWDAKNNCWLLDMEHYKLSDMECQFAYNTFAQAKNILDNIIGKETYAFRAGGYSLETFNSYIDLFKKNGIIIDSSVNRYSHCFSSYHNYDFRKIPKKQVYRFEDSIKKESKFGSFLELSISSSVWNPLYYTLFVRPKIFNYHPGVIYKDGIAIGEGVKVERFRQLFHNKVLQASIDGAASNVLNLIYETAQKNMQNDLVLIGHPKNVSDVSIKNLDNFLKVTTINNTIVTTSDILA